MNVRFNIKTFEKIYEYSIELQTYIVKFSKQETKFSEELSFLDLLTTLFVTSFVCLEKFSSEQVCETMDLLCTLIYLSNKKCYSLFM